MVLTISSIFTRIPPPFFTHYVAAKGAIEAFNWGLSREFPHVRFITVRPEPMLTDQTNSIVPLAGIQSPIDIAQKILKNIEAGDFSPGCHVLENSTC